MSAHDPKRTFSRSALDYSPTQQPQSRGQILPQPDTQRTCHTEVCKWLRKSHHAISEQRRVRLRLGWRHPRRPPHRGRPQFNQVTATGHRGIELLVQGKPVRIHIAPGLTLEDGPLTGASPHDPRPWPCGSGDPSDGTRGHESGTGREYAPSAAGD